jgi:hypothetical protein
MPRYTQIILVPQQAFFSSFAAKDLNGGKIHFSLPIL